MFSSIEEPFSNVALLYILKYCDLDNPKKFGARFLMQHLGLISYTGLLPTPNFWAQCRTFAPLKSFSKVGRRA